MKRLALAVVGCGDIAGYMAWVARLVSQVTLTACCDTDTERARTFAARHRIPHAFSGYGELLAAPFVDAVYLAVPHHLHADMIRAAAETGKSVFVEKPVTRTLAEGRRLLERVRGLKVGVNYQYRYDAGCHALARAIQGGELGRVHSMRINVPWRRTRGYFERAGWHTSTAQAGGGTLITQGSHFLDVALWALEEPPVSAVGSMRTPGFEVEVETLAHGIVETRGGTLINIASTMAAAPEGPVTIEAYGERGTAVYSDRPFPHVNFHGVKIRRARPPVPGVHALQRSLAGFANWVLRDQPFLIPAESALPVLAAVEAIYRSARTGRREQAEDPYSGGS